MTDTKQYTPESTRLEEVNEGTYVLIGGSLASNSGFVITDDGVIVIDASLTPAVASHLMGHIRRTTDRPITRLINTHHHSDHTFGNQVFATAPIVGHANCREQLMQMGELAKPRAKDLRPYLADEIDSVRITPPTITYSERMTLHCGDKTLELMHLGYAHTRGDTVVYLPQERLLFAGDIVFHQSVPFAADAYVGQWIGVIDSLERLEMNAIVPGHGEVCGKAGLRQTRDYLSLLRDEAERCFKSGLSEQSAEGQLRMGEYGHWPGQERHRANLGRVYLELKGDLAP